MVELWFFYIMTAVAMWSFGSIVDKIVLSRKVSAFSYLVYFIPAKLGIPLIFLLLFPIAPVNSTNIVFIMAGIFSGISSVIGYYFYAFATKKEEISRVSALTSIYPIYVAILAAIFLGERFAASRYFGVGLVIAGAVLVSYKKFFSWKTLPISVIIILILASAFWGFEQFLDKVSLNGIDVYSNLVYYMFGNLLTAIPVLIFFGSYRKMVVADLRKMNKTVKILVFVDSITWSIATFLAIIAFSLGPVTLVSAISITWPLVILLYALFLSKLMPDLLKEELGATTSLLKLVSVLLIIFGTYLVVI